MNADLIARAGSAMRWRAAQFAGVEAIYLLRLLIVARILAPEAFGLLAIAAAAIGVLMRVSDVGMIPALVQKASPTREQYDAAWTVGLLRAIAVAVLLAFAALPIAGLFGEAQAAPIIQALALRPVIDASASIGIARLTRELRFRRLALVRLPGAVVDTITAVAAADALGVWALVAGALVGTTTTTILSYVLVPHRPRLVFGGEAVVPLIRFGRWILLTGIVSLTGTTAIQLVLSRTLGVGALGLYFLAAKVAFLPIVAASAVVGSVAFPVFANLREDARRSAATFSTLLTGQALLLLPLYATLIALAPFLEQSLGARWAGAASIMQILSVAAVLGLLAELAGSLLMGRGDARRAFVLQVSQAAVLLVVLLPLVLLFRVDGAALAWLSGNAAAMMLAAIWLRRLMPQALTGGGARLLAALLAAIAAALAASVGAQLAGDLIGLVAGGLLGAAAATAALALLHRPLELQLGEFLKLVRARGTR